MGYYDNVKDDIKNQGDDENSDASFDTLKEAAQEDSSNEQESNDTPIEVLEEGGLKQDRSHERKADQGREKRNTSNQDGESEATGSSPFNSEEESSVDNSKLEQKLDRIIEQNDRMIEILESFRS